MKPFKSFCLFVITLVLLFSCEKVPLGHDSDNRPDSMEVQYSYDYYTD